MYSIMKKNSIALFLIFIVIFSIKHNTTSSLNENDFFLYEIVDCGYYLEIGQNKKIAEGYLFANSYYPSGTIVNSTIGYIAPNGVSFNTWIENIHSVVFLSIDWFDFKAPYDSYYTLFNTYKLIEDFSNIYLIDFTLFDIYPFIDPNYNVFLSSPSELVLEINEIIQKWSVYQTDISFSYNYTENENILFYESWIGGKIDGNFGSALTGGKNYESDITFGNNYLFTVKKDTGIIQGYGRRGWVKGTINDLNVKISISCEYKLLDYELPNYSFGNYYNFLANNNLAIIIAIPSSVVLLIVSILLGFYLRKKRLLKNQSDSGSYLPKGSS